MADSGITDILTRTGFFGRQQELIFEMDFLGRNSIAVPYEKMPKQYQSYLDDLAVTVFDPDGGRLIVTGDALVGKTFIIEQLYANRHIFLTRSGQKNIQFVKVTLDHARMVDTLPGRWNDFVQVASNMFKLDVSELVFVTESVDAAVGLSNLGCRVILELSLATLGSLRRHEHSGVIKQWASWEVVDLNDLFMRKDDLIKMLSLALLDKLNTTYPDINLTQKHIASFVNYAVKNAQLLIDEELDPEHAGMIACPPGVMARAILRLASLAAHSGDSRNKDGNLVLQRIIRRTFSDFEGMFFTSLQQFIEGVDQEDMQFSEIEQAIRGAIEDQIPGVRIVSFRGDHPSKKDSESSESGKLKEFSNISTLKDRLSSKILGQNEAIDEIVNGLKIPAAGLNLETKPLRSLLFLGPTGVGKTELSLTLGKELYNEEIPVKRIDMSEFGQDHESSKLLGAPPGYVGYEAGGVLTNFVKENPQSIVILDEIEKANPKIWDSFLQILDAGRMTDGQGDTVDFTKTIIIMTSNIGADKLNKPALGFISGTEEEQYARRTQDAREIVRKSVEDIFRPEMINRIDQQVLFYELPHNILRDVIAREIGLVIERIATRGYILSEPKDDILDHIANMADASKYGAREIQRVVGKNVYGLLADAVLADKDQKNLKLILKNGKIAVQSRKIGRKNDSSGA